MPTLAHREAPEPAKREVRPGSDGVRLHLRVVTRGDAAARRVANELAALVHGGLGHAEGAAVRAMRKHVELRRNPALVKDRWP